MKYALLLAVVFLAFAQQGQIPPYEGDGNPQHNGQPKFCQNVDSPQYVHNCECQDMADKSCDKSGKDTSKCATWCRKPACRCRVACDRDTAR